MVFLPLWHFQSLYSASSSLQASEEQLWIPRFIDLTAQRSMARFSADLAYASCDLQFARLQTTAEATTRGPWTVDYGGGNIGGSSLNAAAWKLEGKYIADLTLA